MSPLLRLITESGEQKLELLDTIRVFRDTSTGRLRVFVERGSIDDSSTSFEAKQEGTFERYWSIDDDPKLILEEEINQ